MNIITADAAMHATLGRLDQSVEIRDANGNVIGYFTPASQPNARLYSEAAAHFDPEEMKRREESFEGGCTTPELLERLKKLKPI